MNELGRVRRNIVAKFAGEACVRGLGALAFFVLARLMGAEGFGAYLAALAFAGVFVVFHEAGLHYLLSREVARRPASAAVFARQVAVLKGVVAAVVLVAAPAAASWSGMDARMVRLVAIAALALNAASFVEMLGALLVGLERMDAEAVIRGAHKAAQLVLPVAAWLVTRRAGWVLAAQAAASLAALGVARWWAGSRGLAVEGRGRGGLWRNVAPWLSEVWPLTAVTVCSTLAARVDVIFLSRFRQLDETGWYGAASRTFELVQVLPALLIGVLFPILSRLAVGDDADRRARTYERLFRWFAALAVPAAILLHAWSGAIILVCCGPQYAASAAVLRLLAPAMAFSFMGYLFVYALIASDRQMDFLAVSLVGTSVNVVANLLLVPGYGPAGAAWARVTTEAVFFAGGLLVFLRTVHPVPAWLVVRILLAAAAAAGAAWIGHGWVLWGTLAAFGYLAALWLFRVLGRDDLAFGVRLAKPGA